MSEGEPSRTQQTRNRTPTTPYTGGAQSCKPEARRSPSGKGESSVSVLPAALGGAAPECSNSRSPGATPVWHSPVPGRAFDDTTNWHQHTNDALYGERSELQARSPKEPCLQARESHPAPRCQPHSEVRRPAHHLLSYSAHSVAHRQRRSDVNRVQPPNNRTTWAPSTSEPRFRVDEYMCQFCPGRGNMS